MNINDNKLNELIEKTERTIKNKSKRRRYITASSLAAAVVIISIFAASYINTGNTPDVVMRSPGEYVAASENTPIITPEEKLTQESPETTPLLSPSVSESPAILLGSWSETRVIDGSEITVNLALKQVNNPSEYSSCVYEVSSSLYDLPLIKSLASYFMQNEIYSNIYTKSDYKKIIEAIKEANSGKELTRSELKTKNDLLNQYLYQLDNAPSENTKAKIEFFSELQKSVNIKSYYNENAISELNVLNGDINSILTYKRGDLGKNYVEFEKLPTDGRVARGFINSPELAFEIAENVIKEFAEGMIIANITYGNLYNPYDQSLSVQSTQSKTDQCYIFYYTRYYKEANASGISGERVLGIQESEMPNYNFDKREYIKIVIDKDGIFEFSWHNKTKTTRIVDSNASLITANQAIELFKNNIFKAKKWTLSGSNASINVYGIEFCMMKVRNTDGAYHLVPAYAFKGTQTIFPENDTPYSKYIEANSANIIVINAIDGSIIE